MFFVKYLNIILRTVHPNLEYGRFIAFIKRNIHAYDAVLFCWNFFGSCVFCLFLSFHSLNRHLPRKGNWTVWDSICLLWFDSFHFAVCIFDHHQHTHSLTHYPRCLWKTVDSNKCISWKWLSHQLNNSVFCYVLIKNIFWLDGIQKKPSQEVFSLSSSVEKMLYALLQSAVTSTSFIEFCMKYFVYSFHFAFLIF